MMLDIERSGRFVPEDKPATTVTPAALGEAGRLLLFAEDLTTASPAEATRLTLRALAILVQWEADHEAAITAILDEEAGR